MSTEILVNITPMESRVAFVENGVLQEVSIERTLSRGPVGNIYKGKVVRVLPGMQAAFVDIGLDKAGFIHVDDILRPETNASSNSAPDIRLYLREGQSLLVQVIKNPISTKGARLSTRLTVSSRLLVYMPNVDHVGVSQRIADEQERQRLRSDLDTILLESDSTGGYIIRTSAEGVEGSELSREVAFLQQLWVSVEKAAKGVVAPAIVYEDLPLYLRAIRDMGQLQVEKVRVDSREVFNKLLVFTRQFNPDLTSTLEYYTDERPLFYLFGVEDEISRALDKKVSLKSGGSLVIEQTEAMTTVDVNTGAFVGHRNLEETIFKTNLEAAYSIARQLRLRNLGGIIIIDFIDMQDAEHRRQVMRALEKALSRDRAKTAVVTVSELGLVEMTRKRISTSLGHTLCVACPVCDGRGTLRSVETVCYDLLREILREARTFECQSFLVLAASVVIERLLDEESDYVAGLEKYIGRSIQFQVETMYNQEQYDIIPV